MSDNGHMEHDPNCKEPLNEHTGSEPCIRWIEDVEEVIPIRRYTTGPQGNQVIDYGSEWEDTKKLYGLKTPTRVLGTPGISDIRDNRDPIEVANAHFAHKTTAHLNGA